MGIIKRLAPHEAQKIAAGEVVERPANVVKELIENALDAGATKVIVHLRDGGKAQIRVVDNGCGMSAEDAPNAFVRHATSKITSVDELEQITTFGFRGEALASAAAVGKVTLRTRDAKSEAGTQLILEEGTIQEQESIACPVGTDIEIRDLFYNVPARKKFLKRREIELRHITQIIQAFGLEYPSVHFTVHSEEKQLHTFPPAKNQTERFKAVFDQSREIAFLAVELKNDRYDLRITGTISGPGSSRYDRSGIFLFVNKRWVTNYQLSRALLNGYQNALPHGQYPMAALHISIDPTTIDVNVHPRKQEIQFSHPRVVEQAITQAVREALEKHVSGALASSKKDIPRFTPTAPPIAKPASSTFVPFDFDGLAPAPSALSRQPAPEINPTPAPAVETSEHTTQQQVFAPSPTVDAATINQPAHTTHVEYRIIGQYHKTYILLESGDDLCLIDQHAAHERVLYEQFKSRFKELPSVELLFPQTISLSTVDAERVTPHLEFLKDNGITIEPFGETQFVVRATPVHLKDASLDDLLRELAGWVTEYHDLEKERFEETIHKKLRAQMACKAAVKAGDDLSMEQMQQLLRDLDVCDNRFSCPHGRPTQWPLTLHEIEKRFRRKT